MKGIILLLGIFIFSSCAKSNYYAYENRESNSYCTIEVTRQKEFIYRASSSNYWNKGSKKSNKFIYMSSMKNIDFTKINNDDVSFLNNFLEIYYINNFPPRYKFGAIENTFPNKIYINFLKKDNDSLKSEYYIKDLPKQNSLDEAGVNWFPPYMLKVNKINYLKFPKEIQHMNLKDPLESVNYVDDFYYGNSDAYISQNKNGKYGFSNRNFDIIIKPKFDFAHSSVKDYYPVKKDEKWGVINSKSKTIIEFIYSDITILNNDNNFIGIVANIEKNGLYALLNMKNELLTLFKYTGIYNHSKSFFLIEKEDKYGIINSDGKEIIEPIYDFKISGIQNYDLLIAEKESKIYIFDYKGNFKLECDNYTFEENSIPIFKKGNLKYILKDNGIDFIEKTNN